MSWPADQEDGSNGVHPKINRWVEEFLNNRTLRVKLGDQHSSEDTVKSGLPQGAVLGPLLFLIFINDLADELTCNHLFFAEDAKLIAPRSQQHELRSSIQKAFTFSRRWDPPLNASKSHHLSIGGTPDLRIALSEEPAGKPLQKCEQINDLGITVNVVFNPLANVLDADNKARGIWYFIKRSLTCLTNKIFVPLYSALVRPHFEYTIQANCPYLKKGTNYLERILRSATWCVKGLRGLTYEERLQALKLQTRGKRRLRNDLVLVHRILYNHIDLDATQLFKFSRRPGLRRSSIRLLHQPGRTRRR